MRSEVPILLVLAVLLTDGCGNQSLPGPALSAVCLLDDSTSCVDWVYAGESAEVMLLGRHFHAPIELDLDSRDNPPLDDRFTARLGDVSIQDLEMAPGLLDEQQVLTGWLPGELPVGSHDLELDAPTGQRARLEDAFTVRTPLQASLIRDEPQLPIGSVVHVFARFDNLAQVPLSDVTAHIAQQGTGRIELPAPVQPFVLAADQSLSIQFTTRADAAGPLRLLLEVSGNAAGRVPVVTESQAEIELLILQPAELSATPQLDPLVLGSGEPFALAVQVANLGGTPVQQVRLLPPVRHGTGTVELVGPPPEVSGIPAGQSRTLRWNGKAGNPGTVEFEMQLTAVEAISGRRIGPLDAGSIQLDIE